METFAESHPVKSKVILSRDPDDAFLLAFSKENKLGYLITGDKEIDFVCERQGEKIYIQCAYLLTDDQTIEREFGNLLLIKDNYPKFVITMDDFNGNTNQGIIHSNLREFLQKAF